MPPIAQSRYLANKNSLSNINAGSTARPMNCGVDAARIVTFHGQSRGRKPAHTMPPRMPSMPLISYALSARPCDPLRAWRTMPVMPPSITSVWPSPDSR